jgi:site-specific DNA-methyltransferase (adenine-specific)
MIPFWYQYDLNMYSAGCNRQRDRQMSELFFGDNLDVLRQHIPTESVDLIYLDPPFNSKANYNILFKSPTGVQSDAQIEAFEDTWHWNHKAEEAFDQVGRSGHIKAFDLLNAMRAFLGENDMMAYLTMMSVRLIELHRVLKPTGSLYLHCDPTASHYLKLLLDGVFGAKNFRNNVVWKRSAAHGDATRRFGQITDHILFYAKSDSVRINKLYTPHSEEYLAAEWQSLPDGRLYKTENMLDPSKKMAIYDFKGTEARWRYNPAGMQALWDAPQTSVPSSHGRIKLGRNGNPTKRCRIVFNDELQGNALQDNWNDIGYIAGGAGEGLGYPTQKPLALLERIIAASSREGDTVLDPFCGCGTAVHAAQKLGRQWIGIDVTHLAISLIEKRMKAAFPEVNFSVEGTPKDLASAQDLARRDKYQFQWWAVSMVDAMPFGGKKKGADGGVDGIIYFKPDGKRTEKALVSVKGGANVGVTMIRDLHSAMEREKAPMGVFLTLAEPSKPMRTAATAVGLLHSEQMGRSYPRLQIVTLAELFEGKRPEMPWIDPTGGFKRAGLEAASQPSLL